jgi:acyl-CoA thioesterase-1
MWDRILINHVASGQAFFTGAGCLLAAIVVDAVGGHHRWAAVARNVAILLGLALVGMSSAGQEGWVYGVVGLATLGWLATLASPALQRRMGARGLTIARMVAAVAWVGAMGLEAPYHGMLSRPASVQPPMVMGLVADSITAGMNQPRITTWPRLLAAHHAGVLTVRDHSLAGATTATALRDQAPKVAADESLVWLEIGGNDLLSGVPAATFAANLDRLLRTLARPGRTLVMMELPLIPGARGYSYSLAQRRLARRYGALLIPRRVLADILLAPGATQDTVHLTQAGHDQMARVVWEWLQPLLRPGHDRTRT